MTKTMIKVTRLCRVITKSKMCSCLQLCSVPNRHMHNTKIVSSSEGKTESIDSSSIEDLSEPTNCCMSGCANCVWIQYAEKLSATLEKSDVDVQKLIIDKIQDPNMKAFLSMELRIRRIIKD